MRVRVFGGSGWLLAGLAALLLVLAAAALGRAPAPSSPPSRVLRSGEVAHRAREASASQIDLARIRDVFRFVDEPRPGALREPATARLEGRPAPSTPPGPRLVGLVRRGGRLMAALTRDGDVELAGPGDSAAGVTVLSVGEEGVRVRLPDGTEQTFALP